MVLTKREKLIAIVAAVAVALLLVYWLAISPYIDKRTTIAANLAQCKMDISNADQLKARQHALEKVWTEMQQGGLISNSSLMQSTAQNAVSQWEKQSGVVDESINGGQITEEGKFQIISFSVSVHGTTPAVARFLWAMETTTIPVRVISTSIHSIKEGTDQISVTLSISTLCMKPDAGQPQQRVAMNDSFSMERQ